MSSMRRAAIAGTGSYVPARVLSNAELERMVETTDAWIVERTGIRERRIAAPEESTSTMAIIAARRACEDAGINPADIEMIIVATITPDFIFPATACQVQHAIGAKRAAGFDLEAACSGFVYAVNVASSLIASGMYKNVLVIGAETLSRLVNYEDRSTCILFGDGAGAAVLTARDNGSGVLHTSMRAEGEESHSMLIPAGGSHAPASAETVVNKLHTLHMDGRRVFKFATKTFIELVEDALAACKLRREDVAMVIPHQVNQRIIEAAVKKLEMPLEKFFVNLERYGNTSAASVPIALDEARRAGRIHAGDHVITIAFGGGLTWGSTVFRL
jgi:3-oxoacyl-[acyl-carrier-protein] synthase-3